MLAPFGAPAEPGGERTRGHERGRASKARALFLAVRADSASGRIHAHLHTYGVHSGSAESRKLPVGTRADFTPARSPAGPPTPAVQSLCYGGMRRTCGGVCPRWLSPPGLSRSLGHNACGLLCVRCRASNVVLLRLSQLLWPRLRAPARTVPAGSRPSCPMVPCARWRRPRAALRCRPRLVA